MQRFKKLRGPRWLSVTSPGGCKEIISAEQLVRQFPFGSLVYVTITCDLPDKKYPERGLLKDQDVVRVSNKGWELLASNQRDWAEDELKRDVNSGMTRKQIVESVYKETEYIYEEDSHGCITARIFYPEDKKLLRGWKFVTPELKEILKKGTSKHIM